MAAGTPGFQSPEQLKGEGIGINSDVYAFSGVLTEFFGGEPLWSELPSHTIMYKVAVEGVMPDTSHLPTSIFNIVQLCLCPVHARASAVTILGMLCAPC